MYVRYVCLSCVCERGTGESYNYNLVCAKDGNALRRDGNMVQEAEGKANEKNGTGEQRCRRHRWWEN